ncbi:MAG TPA: endo-1,4-beta-xylanase [Terriglobales bacterium]|nr:endo-1,4-beta-xylanase [Terriglobales bacterium]
MNRRWLRVSALMLLFTASILAAQTLRQQASEAGIMLGAAVNVHYLSEAAYTSTLSREFNMLEPEDAMKWEILRPNEKSFDFKDADRIVEFARTHAMKVRGHNLVWGTHNPKWLTQGSYPSQMLSALLRDHINQVVGHFRDKVFAWDVVNEAFDEKGKLRDSIWYNRPGIGAGSGTAYIEQAFRWAHEADAQALLFYNEAEAEELNPKSDAIYAMIQDFRRRGVPIDGIGFQMHIYNLNPNSTSIAANFTRFSKLGIQIHITEMDVALPVTETGTVKEPGDLERQAKIYEEIAEICLQTPGCTAIQTWGVTDKYSWLGWATHQTGGAGLLFDREYHPKPAYKAIEKALNRRSSQQN